MLVIGRVKAKLGDGDGRRTRRLQSAMEYLMTYGWSILIIAIVLAALFELGVFGGGNLSPRAQPNSCRVFRPGGVGSTANLNLQGVCNGELPEYVAQFNGQSSWVGTGTAGFPTGNNPVSVFAWVYYNGPDPITGIGGVESYGSTTGFLGSYLALRVSATSMAIDESGEGPTTAFGMTPNTWQFVGYTWNGNTQYTFYLNGLSVVVTGPVPSNIVTTTSYLGTDLHNPGVNSFNGFISNVQIYNTLLDANTVQLLYQEGIGGAPVEPKYLTAWWPLNGDVNDYSGNGNNGVPANIIFTNAWANGYTVP